MSDILDCLEPQLIEICARGIESRCVDTVYQSLDIVGETGLKYKRNFSRLVETHPLYYKGWKAYFFTDWDRDAARVAYLLIAENKDLFQKVGDLACYDGIITALLSLQGFDVYGYDNNDFPEMFELLGITDKVFHSRHPFKGQPANVCIATNFTHMYPTFNKFMEWVCDINNGVPSYIFTDRDRRRGLFSEYYYSEEFMQKQPTIVTITDEVDFMIIKVSK